MIYERLSLPLGTHLIDAQHIADGLTGSESLYVTYSPITKCFYLSVRTFDYETDWESIMRLTQDEARDIVRAKIAEYWLNVPESMK